MCLSVSSLLLSSPELLYKNLDDPSRIVSALNPHALGGHLLICAAIKMLVIESHNPWKEQRVLGESQSIFCKLTGKLEIFIRQTQLKKIEAAGVPGENNTP